MGRYHGQEVVDRIHTGRFDIAEPSSARGACHEPNSEVEHPAVACVEGHEVDSLRGADFDSLFLTIDNSIKYHLKI